LWSFNNSSIRRRLLAWEEDLVGSLGFYFKMSLCRLTKLIGGWKHLPFIQFKALTIFWMQMLLLIFRWLCLLCDIKMFLWRWRYLRDVCFGIGFLPRTTSSVDRLLLWMLKRALEIVGKWKHLIIYFFIVTFLGLFGILFLGGLVFIQLCLTMLLVILISSVLLVVLPRQSDLSYRLYGMQRCEKFGKKGTTGSSMEKIALFCKWLIRLSR